MNINGGTATTRDLTVAGGDGYNGTVNVNSGLLYIYGDTTGAYFGSDPYNGTTTGTANINICGGTLQIEVLNPMGTNALINITKGQLLLAGDQVSTVNSYISGSQIVAHSGQGSLLVDYDQTTTGYTTVQADFLNITTSLSLADEGETVIIPAGTHTLGEYDLDIPLTLESQSGPYQTTIEVEGRGICVSSSGVTIKGFTITTSENDTQNLITVGKSASGTSYAVEDITIEDNILTGMTVTDNSLDYAVITLESDQKVSSVKIDKNRITGISYAGTSSSGVDMCGILVKNGGTDFEDIKISNNTLSYITSNDDLVIGIDLHTGVNGYYELRTSLENNTIACLSGNAGSYGVIFRETSDNCCLVANSISQTTVGVLIKNGADDVVLVNNSIYDNVIGIDVKGSASDTTLLSNGIYNNITYAIRNTSSVTLNAENNYWGDQYGPYHSSNTQSHANPVTDDVDFDYPIQGCDDDIWHINPAEYK
ncbi:MAG: hypothetical protein ACIAQZ_05685 [Sedimentisphaeraceae bacterium JB056]